MRSTAGLACTAAPIECDGKFGVLDAGLDANADRSRADRFDGDAAALKHRDETQTFRAVDDDLEAGVSRSDAARVMRNRAQVGTAPRQFAAVAPFAPLVGQNGS
jgi:hypothetical protein